jgi:hypothetical protein
MDKQLLKALDNLSDSLEQIALALASNKDGASATGAALKGGDFGKQLEAINVGIQSIKTDTQEILSNQKTIIALSKEKSKDVIEESGTDKKKESSIKKGVGTILLIAVAVLAIGLALKLVGPVDVLSAIGLGLAMVAIGFAFAQVAEATKGSTLKDIALASLAMVFMSIAVALSSYALAMIKPISFMQALTAVFIAGVFSVVAFGMRKMLKAFKGLSFASLVKSVIFLPMILPAIALGIALASYALGLVQPIGFSQVISSIFIAAIFSVVSFGIRNLLKSFKGLNTKTLIQASIFLPLIMPAIALGIAASSYVLALVQPVTFMQWFVAVLIAILFVVLSFGMVKIVKAMNKMKWSSLPKIPIFFTLISIAIMVSSHILALTADISWGLLLKIAAIGILMAGLTIALVGPMKILGKMGIADMLKGALAMVLIAAVVMISSHILALGNYDTYPGLEWIIGVGLSMATFGIAAVLLGLFVFGPQALVFLAGLAAILVVALTMVAVDYIQALGNYETYPGVEWLAGVALAMTVFAGAAIILGIMVFGPQALIFLAGLAAILVVAATILGVSKILSKGKYDNKGMLEWSVATALLYATFTPIIMALGVMSIAGAIISFFGGDDPFLVAQGMMLTIADTIVAVSHALYKGNYKGGPTQEWADGIAIALGAFMPIYNMLMANSIMSLFGGGGVGPDDFSAAIGTVSDGIISAAEKFSGASAAFAGGPPEDWARGVGLAIGAFSPVYKVLSEQDGWFSDGPSVDDMANAIRSISGAIIESAGIFAQNNEAFTELYPSQRWGTNVGLAIGAFSPVFTAISEGSGWFTSGEDVANGLSYAIRTISYAIVSSGRIFAGADPTMWEKEKVPGERWGVSVAGAIDAFSQVFTLMSEGSGWFTSGEEVAEGLASGIRIISWSIRDAGSILGGLDKEVWDNHPTEEWGKGIRKGINSFLDIFDDISSRGMNTAIFSMYAQMLEGGVQSMADTAWILYTNRKYFTVKLDNDFIPNIATNVMGFATLGRWLDDMLVTTSTKTTSEGGIYGFGESTKTEQIRKEKDMGIIDRVAQAMSNTAFILYKNKKYFDVKIDPNFIRKLSRNIIDYTRLAEYLTRVEEKEGSFLGSIAGAFGYGGDDPIMRIAGGMVVLADSYDILTTSFEKFGIALEAINMEKLKEVKSLQTDQLANDLSQIKSENDGGWHPMDDLGKFTGLWGGDKKESPTSVKKKGPILSDFSDKSKYGEENRTIPQQLDLLIGLLTNIDKSTNTIDEFIQDASDGKIQNVEELN